MPRQNSPQTYGSVSKFFHWSIALLILALIPLGGIANDLPYGTSAELALKAQLFSLHKTLGVVVFFLALGRILWALSQPKPAPLHPNRRLETFVAETVHWSLYASLVIVPLSGWIHHAATTGFAPIYWPLPQDLPLIPKSDALAHTFASLHWVATKVLVAALLLHIAGALKHALIDRDATLARMWPGKTPALTAPAPAPHSNRRPFVAAVLVWAAALGLGTVLAAFEPSNSAPVPTLERVASEWQVRDGTLDLTVRQLGSPVSGRFTDWTAAISFEETPDAAGQNGTVEVQVSVASLTLGSVTENALSSDFLDAAQFARATFRAPITATDSGYIADGTLTLRGVTLPLALPFTLILNENTAEMAATVTLDRRDFGIGASYADESPVGYDVTLDIALTAVKP